MLLIVSTEDLKPESLVRERGNLPTVSDLKPHIQQMVQSISTVVLVDNRLEPGSFGEVVLKYREA